MSGGEQLRDYLPVEKVAEYIVRISIQNKSMALSTVAQVIQFR